MRILYWLVSSRLAKLKHWFFLIFTQSCPTLCNPMDCSPPDSSVHGDSPGKNTWVGCHALNQGIFTTLWIVASQAPLSMGFPRQEYCSGLPRPPPGDLSDPGIKPMSPVSPAQQVNSLPLCHLESPKLPWGGNKILVNKDPNNYLLQLIMTQIFFKKDTSM